MVDPYYNDIPWEIIYDESGQVIGEVFLIPQRRKKRNKKAIKSN